MDGGHLLGSFELLVLLAVARLGADAHGVAIRRVIAERTSRVVSTGAVYTTLDRLERKGLVSSGERRPVSARSPRRFYRVSAAGGCAVTRSLRDLEHMGRGLTLPIP